MNAIWDCVRTLIEYQTEDYPDADIQAEQEKLNGLYDDFSKKYGMINARANNSAFSSDSSYCLLSSLEVLDDDNICVWSTGNYINTDEVKNGKIKFTVKDHNQFKGIKQTVVTRCKLSA